ncbi:zinc finger and SCAN domain-containing protein 30-like [Sphaerodactylus townsendi]|uniref:zinc finger and SCAN domain-containing protein 30-like n=1 Tax=Sphaerodactylus townsendi TaxID=933632 RepID=UPI002025F782|nr:zinc finger and SCAN domain-containing protein 30-like [Sphaerodactylus townsendi]
MTEIKDENLPQEGPEPREILEASPGKLPKDTFFQTIADERFSVSAQDMWDAVNENETRQVLEESDMNFKEKDNFGNRDVPKNQEGNQLDKGCSKSIAHHNGSYHGAIQERKKRIECSTCGKSFASIPNLKAHWNIHTGENHMTACSVERDSVRAQLLGAPKNPY